MRVSIDRHMYIYLDGFASSWLPRPATAKRGRFAPCLEIEGFVAPPGWWRVMCVVAVAGVSGRELRMPARGPVGGVRLGWLGRWGGVRGVADFFESFQCRKPGRSGGWRRSARRLVNEMIFLDIDQGSGLQLGVSVEAPVVQEHLPRCGSTPPRCISLNRRRCSPNCQR